jgi:hypothetical protein
MATKKKSTGPKATSSGSKGFGEKPTTFGRMPAPTPKVKAALAARHAEAKAADEMFRKAIAAPTNTPERLKNKRTPALRVKLKSNMQGGLL